MTNNIHVIVFPMPVQGHINPMLQFSNRLASKGLTVTLVATASSITKSVFNLGSVNIETIPDELEGVVDKSDSSLSFMDRFKAVVAHGLTQLMKEKKNSNNPPKVLLYDSILPWMLDIARENGLLGVTFFTQSCSICSVIYHLHIGNFAIPMESDTVSLPGLPLMGMNDLPLFVFNGDKNHNFMEFMTNQFANIREVDWILFNTFEELEEEAVSWMRSQFPLKTIGPTIPSIHINKNQTYETNYGLSLFKASPEISCMDWLSTKPKASVIYVSFGSLATLQDEQLEELSQALENNGHYYLWVVRASEKNKLKERTSEKGLIVDWCAQIEVLAHDSIGCFMTHCGWNSTLEGLTLGVPMVAMPQWSDQPTNAKCIVDVWDVGVRVKVDEKGVGSREEIESCIEEVMGGERRDELRRNAVRWKVLAREAIWEGGSSDRNIKEFVSEIACSEMLVSRG